MSEYATEIRIRFYDDAGIFKVEDLFEALQNLKARDYYKLNENNILVEAEKIYFIEELIK